MGNFFYHYRTKLPFMLLLSNRGLISVFVIIAFAAIACSSGCVEGEGDNMQIIVLRDFGEYSGFFGVAGDLIGKVDKSVTTVSGEYYQERGPINPDEGEYPMVLVFKSGGECDIYESVNGYRQYCATFRYSVKDGKVYIRLSDEYDENSILIRLGIEDGGAKLVNDANTFVRI